MTKYHTCSNVIPPTLIPVVCFACLRLPVCPSVCMLFLSLCVRLCVSLHVYTCVAFWCLLKKNNFSNSNPLSIWLVALNHTDESKAKIPDMVLMKSHSNSAIHAHTGLREPMLVPAFSHFQLVCNSKSLIWRRRNSFAHSDDKVGPHL